MSKAGRAEHISILIKVLLAYSSLLFITYIVINASMRSIHSLPLNSLSEITMAAFLVFLISLLLRIIKSVPITNYLLLISLILLGITLFIQERIIFGRRSVKVYTLPLINVLVHDDHRVLSIDLGQLFILAFLILIIINIFRFKKLKV